MRQYYHRRVYCLNQTLFLNKLYHVLLTYVVDIPICWTIYNIQTTPGYNPSYIQPS